MLPFYYNSTVNKHYFCSFRHVNIFISNALIGFPDLHNNPLYRNFDRNHLQCRANSSNLKLTSSNKIISFRELKLGMSNMIFNQTSTVGKLTRKMYV